MFKSRHPLVTLVLCFFSSTLCAQSAVNVEINGIGKILEENVRLYLSIEQQKNHPLISDRKSLQPCNLSDIIARQSVPAWKSPNRVNGKPVTVSIPGQPCE
jgi:hypothetical protein